jgi:hypothetical protein
VIAFPFLLFILDNYILHSTPEFVKHLPFTVPLLIGNRLAQIANGSALQENIHFVTSGFNDGLIWNTMPWYAPLGLLSIPLAFVGVYYCVRRGQAQAMIFVLWLLATFPLFFLFPLNINRANIIFIPLIALNAIGLSGIYDSIERKQSKTAVIFLVLVVITMYNGVFCYDYFRHYNSAIQSSFNAGFDIALAKATSAASPGETIYVSERINTNYVYTLFFLRADAQDFQRYSHISIVNGSYQVDNYRNYYFSLENPKLASVSSYVGILKGNERLSCRRTQPLYSGPGWTVERCFN